MELHLKKSTEQVRLAGDGPILSGHPTAGAGMAPAITETAVAPATALRRAI